MGKKRELTKAQALDDTEEIYRILSKEKRSKEDVDRLIYLFDWYAHHSPDSYKWAPPDLIRVVATELVKYRSDRNYPPFGANPSGAPTKADWEEVERHARRIMELDPGDWEVPIGPREAYLLAIKTSDVDISQMDTSTRNKRIKKFEKEYKR